MRTFQDFLYICEDLKKLKDIVGPGVPSERPTNLTSIQRLTTNSKLQGAAINQAIPLSQATYRGRVEAGRNTSQQGRQPVDNPDFQGPMGGSLKKNIGLDSGQGTRDKMPGTTPSNNPHLPNKFDKYTKGFRIKKQFSPIKPIGTSNLV